MAPKRINKVNSSKLRDIALIAALKRFGVLAQAANLPSELVEKVSGELIQKIGQSKPSIENRLAGLRAEDEFLLMTLLLNNAEQITPLDQGQWVNWAKYGVPDFLMSVYVPKEFLGNDEGVASALTC